MADSGHDDLADALSRLASGDIEPSEHLHSPDNEPIPEPGRPNVPVKPPHRVRAPVAAPVAPAPVTPAPVRPVARPAAPRVVPVTPPVVQPAAAPPVARPSRPAAPTSNPVDPVVTAAQANPSTRPQRPVAPPLRPVSVPVATPPPPVIPDPDDSQIIDDDDSVIVPAYESAVLAKAPKVADDARAKIARKKRLEFRRTTIPVLLTTGVLLFAFGMIKFVVGDESSLSALPNSIPYTLFAGGVLMLALAAVNMASVRQEMATPD